MTNTKKSTKTTTKTAETVVITNDWGNVSSPNGSSHQTSNIVKVANESITVISHDRKLKDNLQVAITLLQKQSTAPIDGVFNPILKMGKDDKASVILNTAVTTAKVVGFPSKGKHDKIANIHLLGLACIIAEIPYGNWFVGKSFFIEPDNKHIKLSDYNLSDKSGKSPDGKVRPLGKKLGSTQFYFNQVTLAKINGSKVLQDIGISLTSKKLVFDVEKFLAWKSNKANDSQRLAIVKLCNDYVEFNRKNIFYNNQHSGHSKAYTGLAQGFAD